MNDASIVLIPPILPVLCIFAGVLSLTLICCLCISVHRHDAHCRGTVPTAQHLRRRQGLPDGAPGVRRPVRLPPVCGSQEDLSGGDRLCETVEEYYAVM